jgi:hypothetical protein
VLVEVFPYIPNFKIFLTFIKRIFSPLLLRTSFNEHLKDEAVRSSSKSRSRNTRRSICSRSKSWRSTMSCSSLVKD